MVTILHFEEGDEIPEKYFRMLNWSPSLAAMLFSGIFPSAPKNSAPFDNDLVDPVALLKPFDQFDFQFFKITSWRAKKYQYILNLWLQNHFNNNQPAPPKTFLSWLERNPLPVLDYNGIPISPPTLPRASESASSTTSTRRNRTEKRSDPLSELIEKCRREVTDPQNHHLVYEKLIEKSKPPTPSSPLLEYVKEDGIKYMSKGEIKFLTIGALKKRINPNARGKRKSKQANTNGEPTET